MVSSPRIRPWIFQRNATAPARTIAARNRVAPDAASWHRVRHVEIRTGRPATLAPNGMVTSPHALASAAGVAVLRAGGSAIDAAIAASAVLAVVYPHMTSIGGDAFWLIHEGKTGRVRYLGGGGRAAASAHIAWFGGKGFHAIPLKGIIPATLTVPGAVASWTEAHAAYGRIRCVAIWRRQ